MSLFMKFRHWLLRDKVLGDPIALSCINKQFYLARAQGWPRGILKKDIFMLRILSYLSCRPFQVFTSTTTTALPATILKVLSSSSPSSLFVLLRPLVFPLFPEFSWFPAEGAQAMWALRWSVAHLSLLISTKYHTSLSAVWGGKWYW